MKHKRNTNKQIKTWQKTIVKLLHQRVVIAAVVFGVVGLPFAIGYAYQHCTVAGCSADTVATITETGSEAACADDTNKCADAGGAVESKETTEKAAEDKKAAAAAATAAAAKQTTGAGAGTASAGAAAPAAAPVPASNGMSAKYGIAGGSSLTRLSGTALASTLDDMKSMGVGWVRFDIEWSNIEASQGNYNWGAYDAVVQGVRARGMRVLGVIDYTPGWARPGGCGSDKCAPADPANYGNFAGVVAAHYSGNGIAAYEIWNEPNSTEFFKPAANASQYTQMLKAAYTQIKAASPGSQVITGGTSPRSTGGGELSPVDFVQGLYDAGAKGSFDAVSGHPYTFPVTAAYPNPYNAWGQLETFHNIMANNGDGGKLVWSTEVGAPTGGPGPTATASNLQIGSAWHVDEALQAQAVTDAIRLNSATSWKGPLLWYSYKDAGTTQDTNENFFGLVRADGSRKPAYASFVQALNTYN